MAFVREQNKEPAMFNSIITRVGELSFPQFTGTRVMMMPVRLEDADSLPIPSWIEAFKHLIGLSPIKSGTAYITIDEAQVSANTTQRRPGLHVDGVGPDGKAGGWGGGGGGWGAQGMLVAASVVGCRGWNKEFDGFPKPNGDCSHLQDQCNDQDAFVMEANNVYAFGSLGVHESLPMTKDTQRQFVRLSMPNDCPWYEGYTPNPLGIKPTGPIHSARNEFMAFRA